MNVVTPAIVSNFNFNTSAIRVVNIEDAPWFVAADVAKVLKLSNITSTLKSKYIDTSERAMKFIGPDANDYYNVLSESGLYKIILRSKRPEAKGFQDWVTKVVLPAIRKDGGYVAGEEKLATGEMSEDEFILKAMSMMQGKVERYKAERDAAVAQVVKLEEKVIEIVDQYETTDTGVYFRNVLKRYPAPGESSQLGKHALQLSLGDGVQPIQEARTLGTGRKVCARLYQRKYLDKAAKILGFIAEHS